MACKTCWILRVRRAISTRTRTYTRTHSGALLLADCCQVARAGQAGGLLYRLSLLVLASLTGGVASEARVRLGDQRVVLAWHMIPLCAHAVGTTHGGCLTRFLQAPSRSTSPAPWFFSLTSARLEQHRHQAHQDARPPVLVLESFSFVFRECRGTTHKRWFHHEPPFLYQNTQDRRYQSNP